LSKSNDEPAQGDAHLAAFTGGLDLRAMAPEFLSGVAPKRRQTIVAGPGVPYVIPRLMRQEPVRLVISSMTLFEGNATAYFMTYFSDPRLPAWEGHQQWLRENFYFLDAEGRQRWSTRDDAWDPDLAGWLASAPERIFWIAPDDSGMTLLSGAATCPYVNLPGSHMMQHIQSSRIYELGAPIGEKPANS